MAMQSHGVFQGGGSPQNLASNLIPSPAPTSMPSSDPDPGIHIQGSRRIQGLHGSGLAILVKAQQNSASGERKIVGADAGGQEDHLLCYCRCGPGAGSNFVNAKGPSLKNDEYSSLSFQPCQAISSSGVFTSSSWCRALALEATHPDSCLHLPVLITSCHKQSIWPQGTTHQITGQYGSSQFPLFVLSHFRDVCSQIYFTVPSLFQLDFVS